ncbi:MAG: DNA replication and repair protein RecF [Proteobacteria bacterium]|nr:MAG: DNA replication and repair protein RecF [Pseudomonadota bacterium]
MHLTVLAAQGWRNLAPFRIVPDRRFNIVEGRNGQGKTNLLEAVYLLASFRSFRDARNRELVGWGEQRAAVLGEIVRREVARTVEVRVTSMGKQVVLDGKGITKLPAELAHLNVVLFGPDDLSLTKAGPAVRRRFIDRAIYAVWPDYVNDLRSYSAALKNRNRLLRQAQERRIDAAVLGAFERELIGHAARVVHRRHLFLQGYRPHFAKVFDHITGHELSGRITYRGYRGLREEAPPEDIVAACELALDEARATDLKRGFTSVGPHTHDLGFTIDDRSARTYASQGQHRAFVLALKIAELHRLHEALGVYPVFLLDDVSSELDEQRNGQLMDYLDQAGGQVFITTTDRRWIRVSAAPAVYRVEAGRISSAAS